MSLSAGYAPLSGSKRELPAEDIDLGLTDPDHQVTVVVGLRPRSEPGSWSGVEEFLASPDTCGAAMTREQLRQADGAVPADLDAVLEFALQHGLREVDKPRDPDVQLSRRAIALSGSVRAMNSVFGVELHDYRTPAGSTYRSRKGEVNLPKELQGRVVAVTGLSNRKVHATHHGRASLRSPQDPRNTAPLTPQQVGTLYRFPQGTGAGQTIGIYEMDTGDPAGYSLSDVRATMQALGDLPMPNIIDVPVGGVSNSGRSDGETGLDITVASAIAPDAEIAVYFTGGEPKNIIQALHAMIHPDTGQPQPSVLSISYGWGPDDLHFKGGFTDTQFTQITGLFHDAATLGITVLVSSGDAGARIIDKQTAQASYPASDPWVTACGGTTIGNITGGGNFDEYVWNDVGRGGGPPGATGGGVSQRFGLPDYQNGAGVPANNSTGFRGRGLPDIAGNASENSGYPQVINGREGPVGGTSAVAPLYAGLIALLNQALGHSVGFLNPTLYALAAGSVFRDISSPPGPADNSFQGVTGYPADPGWDACTGLGSLNGSALQHALESTSPDIHQHTPPTEQASKPAMAAVT